MTKKRQTGYPLLLMGVVLAGGLAACSSHDEEMALAGGKARMSINLGANSDFGTATRALNEDNWKNAANYTVEVINSANEKVKTYAPGDPLPTYLELPFGSYTVRAFYGAQMNASRDNFLSEGVANVSLQSGDEKTVSVTCAPTCGKAKVVFDSEMATYFSDYFVTYSTPALGSDVVTWNKGDVAPWYLLVDKAGSLVTATIHLVANPEYEVNKTLTTGASVEGTVTKTYTLLPNKSWTLKIAPNYTTSYGELGITIEVDESTNDIEKEIIIPSEWI